MQKKLFCIYFLTHILKKFQKIAELNSSEYQCVK